MYYHHDSFAVLHRHTRVPCIAGKCSNLGGGAEEPRDGLVAWLLRHPQNPSFSKHNNINKHTNSPTKEVWVMALIPP